MSPTMAFIDSKGTEVRPQGEPSPVLSVTTYSDSLPPTTDRPSRESAVELVREQLATVIANDMNGQVQSNCRALGHRIDPGLATLVMERMFELRPAPESVVRALELCSRAASPAVIEVAERFAHELLDGVHGTFANAAPVGSMLSTASDDSAIERLRQHLLSTTEWSRVEPFLPVLCEIRRRFSEAACRETAGHLWSSLDGSRRWSAVAALTARELGTLRHKLPNGERERGDEDSPWSYHDLRGGVYFVGTLNKSKSWEELERKVRRAKSLRIDLKPSLRAARNHGAELTHCVLELAIEHTRTGIRNGDVAVYRVLAELTTRPNHELERRVHAKMLAIVPEEADITKMFRTAKDTPAVDVSLFSAISPESDLLAQRTRGDRLSKLLWSSKPDRVGISWTTLAEVLHSAWPNGHYSLSNIFDLITAQDDPSRFSTLRHWSHDASPDLNYIAARCLFGSRHSDASEINRTLWNRFESRDTRQTIPRMVLTQCLFNAGSYRDGSLKTEARALLRNPGLDIEFDLAAAGCLLSIDEQLAVPIIAENLAGDAYFPSVFIDFFRQIGVPSSLASLLVEQLGAAGREHRHDALFRALKGCACPEIVEAAVLDGGSEPHAKLEYLMSVYEVLTSESTANREFQV